MSSDPFFSPKLKLARVVENIQGLDANIKTFSDSRPYSSVAERDSDGVTQLHKVKLTKPLPPSIGVIAQETIEGMRHSLDQAGYACARLTGIENPKSSYFPFSDTSDQLANVIKGRCKDLPSDIVSLFRSYMPYRGGNDALWAMNKIAGTKHTALVPVGVASGGMDIDKMTFTGSGGICIPRWDSAKQEMVFARTGADSKIDYKINFTFYIAYGDVPVFAGQPVVAVLSRLAGEVAGVLAATEAECRRLGKLKG